MPSDPAFAARVNSAFADLLKRSGRRSISNREIGEAVAKLAHRKKPFTHVAVAGWFGGAKPRSTAEQKALADYLGVEVSWLVYAIPISGEVRGDESPDPAKPLPRPLPRPDAVSPTKGRGTA